MIFRIPILLAFMAAALFGPVLPARAHDPAVSGIRVLYRRHDVVITVTTALSRLSKAERWDAAGSTSEAVDGAVRRRLKLQVDGKDRSWPKANIIADWASDVLSWQTVIPLPDHTVKALGPLYPEDPGSSTVLTVLRDGQAVEEVSLTVAPSGLAQKPFAGESVGGLKEAFTRSIATRRLTPPLVLVALGLAFLFGAMHALSPGHGKTMVAAALVGTRGTAWHAILLGAVVTLTHTVGVFALGVITLAATQQAVPERFYPILTAISGGLIVCVGANLFAQQLHKRRSERGPEAPFEDEEGEGSVAPPLPPDAKLSLRSLVALGITGGAVPCPSALVVMLSAMALHRIAFGLVLILSFSLGLAVVLTGIGLVVVRLGAGIERLPWNARLIARLPIVSAATILLTGIVFMVRAFRGGF
ncbi:MAG: high-affinity nickel-transporter [Chthonomonadaceae bacterium]|nr:high-affinity nickel-transporter [Chthonomonadaceae bacterium]